MLPMEQKQHIVIIELENSHDECLYSQVLFLFESKHKVSMILSPHAYENTKNFHHRCENVVQFQLSSAFGDHRKMIRRIKETCKNWGVDQLVFNTAQGSFVRDFCFFSLFYKKRILGVLHTIKKLEGSFTQRIISLKIKRYFLLSNILLDKIDSKKRRGIGVFYPLFFNYSPKKPERSNTFNILLPGGVERRRKDLDGLIKCIKANEIPTHWKFIFAGKSKPEDDIYQALKQLVKAKNLSTQFHFFETFIPTIAYFNLIDEAAIILPLIHPNTPSNEEYLTRQISGAFNLAYGFKTPMLIHEAFNEYQEFQASSFFYNAETLIETLLELDQNPDLIQTKSGAIQVYPLFHFEHQQSNYLKLIQS